MGNICAYHLSCLNLQFLLVAIHVIHGRPASTSNTACCSHFSSCAPRMPCHTESTELKPGLFFLPLHCSEIAKSTEKLFTCCDGLFKEQLRVLQLSPLGPGSHLMHRSTASPQLYRDDCSRQWEAGSTHVFCTCNHLCVLPYIHLPSLTA